MQFPTKEEIQTLDLQDLIKKMLATFKKREFEITFKEVPSHFSQKKEMGIEDVKDFFHFDVENCTYQFPRIEERETIGVPEFMGRKTVPSKNFFWSMKTEKEEKMFGIVDVLFKINKVSVKANEERFEQTQTVFKEATSYYYDYEKNEYVQINRKGKDNPNTQEYLRRVELLEMCFERLEKENDTYLKLLETAALYLTNQKTVDVVAFIDYFEDYKAHYSILQPFLPLKMLFNHTDSENYGQINAFFKRINQKVDETLLELKTMRTNGILGDLRDHTMKAYHDQYTLFLDIKKELQVMFQIRDEIEIQKRGKEPSQTMDGFYKFDKKRMYENLIQIETVRFFKNSPGTKEQREKEIEALHKRSLESAQLVQDENENTDEYEVLTRDEIEELNKMAGREKKNHLVKLINGLVSQGKISANDRQRYLNRYS